MYAAEDVCDQVHRVGDIDGTVTIRITADIGSGAVVLCSKRRSYRSAVVGAPSRTDVRRPCSESDRVSNREIKAGERQHL